MARQNPASFALGMLFEIAAVVVIVSLLPRFDLRPPTAASEPESRSFSTRLAELTTSSREEVVIPTSFATSEEPRSGLVFTEPKIPQELSAQEVENRLDRASQRLVNTLGIAAASTANEMLNSVGQPVPPFQTLLPAAAQSTRTSATSTSQVAATQPSFPTEETLPGFTYLPPRVGLSPQAGTDSWYAARPADPGSPRRGNSQFTPATPLSAWSSTGVPGEPVIPRRPSTAAREHPVQEPRQWRNY